MSVLKKLQETVFIKFKNMNLSIFESISFLLIDKICKFTLFSENLPPNLKCILHSNQLIEVLGNFTIKFLAPKSPPYPFRKGVLQLFRILTPSPLRLRAVIQKSIQYIQYLHSIHIIYAHNIQYIHSEQPLFAITEI